MYCISFSHPATVSQ